jgi:transposase
MANNKNNWRECIKAFGSIYSFPGFKIIDLERSEDTLIVTLDATELPRCPQCGNLCTRYNDVYLRRVRDLDVSILSCYIQFPICQIRCDCGYRGNQYIDIAHPYSRCSRRFEDYIAQLCSKMTISAVSEITGIDWKTVKQIDMAQILDTIPSLNSIEPKNIGIDEVAYQKGHKYLTVVRDLDLQSVIWVGIGRKTETIDKFFAELGLDKSKLIETCCMDMWDPYINSVKCYTNAKIIFDKFHIVKKVNDALDKLRKRVFTEADPEKKRNMKRKRFLILHKKSNLPDEKVESLEKLLAQNNELFKGYILKEQFLDIFDGDNRHCMPVLRLIQWMDNVVESGIKEFLPIIKTIKRHFEGIMNYFSFGYTNAASEGFNNKINVIKRAAFGFRDLNYFILKIRQACGFN